MKPLSLHYLRQIFVRFFQKLTYPLLITLMYCPASLLAQSKAWVFFKDKPDTTFQAASYFTADGLERRILRNLPIGDHYDLPVSNAYKNVLSQSVDTIYYSSRWLNASAVSVAPGKLMDIAALPFVHEVRPMGFLQPLRYQADTSFDHTLQQNDSLLLRFQMSRMQGAAFRNQRLDGTGITIAVFDVGFKKADEHPAFRHLFDRGAVQATYDFLANDENVFHKGAHGTSVLGSIAGRFDTIPMGLAPGANFLLARTERVWLESRAEEYSWIAAAEWADKHGADIISSSLGYSESRYFPEEMDGRTAPISRAASVAAAKGILVINAVGNEAEKRWGTVVAPADADSVLTVGAIDPEKDVALSFSSYGPAADGTLKPNISNLGKVFTATTKGFGIMEGTSFSTPLSAGFAACLWQSKPGWSNMELFDRMQLAGHLYPYFDLVHGYGIPQASKALGQTTQSPKTFQLDITSDYVNVKVDTNYVPEQDDEGELLAPAKNMFYKISDSAGRIQKYGVVLVESKEPLYFEMEELHGNETIVIHFEGYTYTIELNEHL